MPNIKNLGRFQDDNSRRYGASRKNLLLNKDMDVAAQPSIVISNEVGRKEAEISSGT